LFNLTRIETGMVRAELPAMQSSRSRRWAVSALFFCSGGTALVYEVVWSKYLSQMFGSTIQAQTVVLAVFMGGLALGNFLLSRNVDRLSCPLRAYGYVEAGIGLYAFFFPTLFGLADGIFISVGSRVLGQPLMLLGLKAGLSLGLLLGPTALMGSTLPLMAAWLQQSSTEPGQHSARFYSINSLGAVVGLRPARLALAPMITLTSAVICKAATIPQV
jgi:predicted membrane-bound spermidine synthase